MYQKKAFNRREQDYAMGLRRNLEEARAQKDWYYAMMSYIMGGDSDAEEESK